MAKNSQLWTVPPELRQLCQQTGDQDSQYFFPKLDGAEMRCRWDMQDAPPDIMITNYSMLSIMLMREADQGIFDRTQNGWRRTAVSFI